MTSDIVERLRYQPFVSLTEARILCEEAADEIERLRSARNDALEEAAQLVQRSGQSDDLVRIAATIRVLKEQP